MLRSDAKALRVDAQRAVLTEAVGTATLVMTVVGSGIAAAGLTGDTALQLLFNAFATVAVLGVIVAAALPISGASFNPAVTLVAVLRGEVSRGRGVAYGVAQIGGGIVGTVVAHLMFERDLVSWSDADRGGWGRIVGEVVATAGLIAVIGLVDRSALPLAVPAWILAAYLFTSSTSFANPAVTIGRMFTDTFAGIDAADVPWFVLAQLGGAVLGLGLVLLVREDS